MLSRCCSVLQCIAAPRSLIKMLIYESYKTALHHHGALGLEMHLLYCLFLSNAGLFALLSRGGDRKPRDKYKIGLKIHRFLEAFCWHVRKENIVVKPNDVSYH